MKNESCEQRCHFSMPWATQTKFQSPPLNLVEANISTFWHIKPPRFAWLDTQPRILMTSLKPTIWQACPLCVGNGQVCSGDSAQCAPDLNFLFKLSHVLFVQTSTSWMLFKKKGSTVIPVCMVFMSRSTILACGHLEQLLIHLPTAIVWSVLWICCFKHTPAFRVLEGCVANSTSFHQMAQENLSIRIGFQLRILLMPFPGGVYRPFFLMGILDQLCALLYWSGDGGGSSN